MVTTVLKLEVYGFIVQGLSYLFHPYGKCIDGNIVLLKLEVYGFIVFSCLCLW